MSDHLHTTLNRQGLLELPYPSVDGTNLENTGGGRFTYSTFGLAVVVLPIGAPCLGTGTLPLVALRLATSQAH